ncbi:MAG TPA: hypothetical protein VG650_18255 [Mycobacteriales bacterium]|nr:hypothetical protein [Mycobacteriales bacterium]
MLVCAVDAETIGRCEADALARNVDLLLRVAPETKLPDSAWTAHDVAAHLVSVIGRYLKPDRKLPASPREVDSVNDAEMREFDSATMGELVGRLRSRSAKYAAFWPDLPVEMVLPISIRAGVDLDVAAIRSNWLSELLIHGRDVALAAGEEWPLDDRSCLLTLRLLAYMLPSYLRAGGQGDATLAVAPDGGAPFSLRLSDGGAQMQRGAAADGDRLTGSPAALVLLFYGRIGLAEAQRLGVTTSDADRVQLILDRFEKP